MAVTIDQKNGFVQCTANTDVIKAADCLLVVDRVIFQAGASAGSWTITDEAGKVLGPATYYTAANGLVIIEFGGRKIDGFKLTATPASPVGCCLMLRKPRS